MSNEADTVRRKSRPREFASRALAGCGFAFYDMYFGHAVLGSCAPPIGPEIRVDVRLAGEQDLEAVACRKGEGAAQRFANSKILGGSCVVAEGERTVVGYGWINKTVFEFLGEPLRTLPDGSMCIHDMFVFPEFRGNGVFQHLLAAAFESGRAAGLHSAVCVVDRANVPAVAACRRAGMRFRRAPILKLPGLTPMLLGVRSMGGAES